MEKELQKAQGEQLSEGGFPLIQETGDDLQVTCQEMEGTRELSYQQSIEVQHVTRHQTFETELVQQRAVDVQQVQQQTFTTQQFSAQQSFESENITHKHSFGLEKTSSQQSFSIQEGVVHHLDEADQNQIIHQQSIEVQQIIQPVEKNSQQSVDILNPQSPHEGQQISESGLHIVQHTTAEQISGDVRLIKQHIVDTQQNSQLEFTSQDEQSDHGNSSIINREQSDEAKDGSWHDELKDAWQQSFEQISGSQQILEKEGKETSVEKVRVSVTNAKGDASIAEIIGDKQYYFEDKGDPDGDSENPFRKACQGTEWKEFITQKEDSATESVTAGKGQEWYTKESGRSTSQSSSEYSLDAIGSPKSSEKGAVFKFSHWTPGRTQSVRQIKVRTQDVRRTTSLGGENEPWYSTMEHHIKVLKGDKIYIESIHILIHTA